MSEWISNASPWACICLVLAIGLAVAMIIRAMKGTE